MKPRSNKQTLRCIKLPEKALFALSFLLLCFISLHAQKNSFRKYSVAEGLGGSTVNHIFQDSRGYIWFATQIGGLSRFDGKQFKTFTRANGLISNDVTYVTEDHKGNIWIATAAGVSMFNGSSFINYGSKQGLTDGVVYSIYAGPSGKIFFALKEGGIKILSESKFDSLTTGQGLPSNEAYCITSDKAGNIWFGLVGGIVKYNEGQITSYSHTEVIKDKNFFSAHADQEGNVWFGSIGGGVVQITKGNQIKSIELPSGIREDFIGSIAEDKYGNLWLATDHGLLKYNGDVFKLFTEREGLSVNIVQAVLCDYEGNIWVGTSAGGVNVLSSEAFVQYTDKDGLGNENVNCISRNGTGTYYIGTGEGLYIFNTGATRLFTKANAPKGIHTLNITSLKTDVDGKLWLCAQQGVFVLAKDGNKLVTENYYSGIKGQQFVTPHQLLADSKGNLWIATFGSGVFRIHGEEEHVLNQEGGFASNDILTVYEDSKKNIWFGTLDAGVIKYDGKTFENITEKYNLTDRAVWSVAEGDNGVMFFGTGESGLYVFDDRRITNITSTDGLSSDYITALQWDKQLNCLWTGSEKGLNRVKLKADYSVENIHRYTGQDGFDAVGINPNGISADENGWIWLATVNGMWLYNPANDLEKKTAPKLELKGVRLFYQQVDWRQYADSLIPLSNLPVNLSLAHNKNHLTFDIQALTTDDAFYTFKLEGQDEEWSTPSPNNAITYTNIIPGESYVFRAKAISSRGITSREIDFAFSIKPPWWSTWWFRTAAVLLVIGSLVVFIKTREKVLKERNLKLEETVRLRTKEIEHQKEIVEHTLTEKEGLLHEKEVLLKEIHHRVKNNLQTISSMLMLQSAGLKDELAKKAIAESQSRVRSIALVHQKLYQTDGLEKVELNAFVKDLTQQVVSVFSGQSKNVRLVLNIPETYLLIDTAIPLGLIFNELLTNSYKYAFSPSEEGEIKIELQHLEASETEKLIKRKRVKLSYKDSGPGLPSGLDIENATTLGLRLIKLLSQQIGATLSYSATNGSEFVFTFTLNI